MIIYTQHIFCGAKCLSVVCTFWQSYLRYTKHCMILYVDFRFPLVPSFEVVLDVLTKNLLSATFIAATSCEHLQIWSRSIWDQTSAEYGNRCLINSKWSQTISIYLYNGIRLRPISLPPVCNTRMSGAVSISLSKCSFS